MTSKPSQQFTEWVERQIQSRKPGARLPTADELAQSWGISVSTVTRILGHYARIGALVRIPRRGTFVGPLDQQQPSPPEPVSSSQSIVDEIKRAITNGSLRKGDALPSVKFMSRQFRVAPRTVIAAYRVLEKQTHVVKVGKTYWVGTFSALTKYRQNRRIFVFKSGDSDFAEVFSDERYGLAYHKMEKELVDHGLVVRYEGTDEAQQLLEHWRSRDRWPVGIVLHRANAEDLVQMQPFLRTVLHPRHALKIPVLVDINTADYHVLPRGTHMLSRGNVDTAMARTLARYATSANIRTVRFFMEFDGTNVFSVFVPIKARTELHAFDPSYDTRLYVTATDNSITAQMYREAFNATVPDPRKDAITGKYHFTPAAEIESELEYVGAGRPDYDQIPLGLWVFTSDTQAAAAFEWARHRRIAVPRDLSIITLTNRPRSYHAGVSTCMLDWNSAGYLMAHSLLGDITLELTGKGFIRMSTLLVHRRTTKAG